MIQDHNQVDILKSIVLNSSKGQKVELQNTNISILYFGNSLFFILPSNDSDNGIFVEIGDNILSQFMGKEKFNEFFEGLKEKKNSVIIFQKPFLTGIDIIGNVNEVLDPITAEKNVKVISASQITNCKNSEWKRGFILFKGEDKSYLHINEGLRSRIGKGLKKYIHTNIFGYLTQEINA